MRGKKEVLKIILISCIILISILILFVIYNPFKNSAPPQTNNSTENKTISKINETDSYAAAFGSCNINFRDDDNLDKYLGPNIHPLKESDWMHYQPMIDKVNELTAGLTTDREKAIAISNWVKSSRPYDFESLSGSHDTTANKKFSVIDIFNEDIGVCMDSAIINTAMLRLAEIPARYLNPLEGVSHARTQAYIDKRWIIIDSTFGEGDAEFDKADLPHATASYFMELKIDSLKYMPKYLSLKKGEYLIPKIYKWYILANNLEIFGDYNYANIDTNLNLYSGDSLVDLPDISIEIIRTDDKDLYYAVNENNKVEYVFSSIKPDDREVDLGNGEGKLIIYKKVDRDYHFYIPTMQIFKGVENYEKHYSVNEGWTLHDRFLITSRLPYGKYRLSYNIGSGEGKIPVAYADFEVKKGEITKLTYDLFKKAEGTEQKYFDAAIERIKETWEKCENNPLI